MFLSISRDNTDRIMARRIPLAAVVFESGRGTGLSPTVRALAKIFPGVSILGRY
jgi:hypothetical protein